MLPKQHRLPGHLVLKTLNSSNTYHSPLFSLKAIETKTVNHPTMVGFIISTKINKLAVNRNRLKRQLKASLYSELKRLKPNLQLVFLAKHPLKKASFKEIKTALKNLLKQAKFITNEKTSSQNN